MWHTLRDRIMHRMWRRLLLVGLLAVGTQGFAPTPIGWGGRPAQKFILAPRALLTSAAVPSQQLRVWDLVDKTSPNDVHYFVVNPGQTITWNGMCMEARGAAHGDAVSVGHCLGGPNGLWDIIPGGGKTWIRLKDRHVCLSVNDKGGLHGAPVELQECEDKISQLWKLEESLPLPTRGAILASSMQRGCISFLLISAIGALSLTAWLWRWSGVCQVAVSCHGLPLNGCQGGMCVSTPTASTEMYQGNMQKIIPAAMAIDGTAVGVHLPRLPSGDRLHVLQGIDLSCQNNQKFKDDMEIGAVVWPCAAELCGWLQSNELAVRGTNVLELGAGTGACGLFAAGLGARVLLTDGRPGLLPLQAANLKRNSRVLPQSAEVTMQVLRWGETAAPEGPWDWVLGSDVIFSEENDSELIVTLADLLCQEHVPRAVLAYTHRSGSFDWRKTWKGDPLLRSFIAKAELRGLAVELIQWNGPTEDQWRSLQWKRGRDEFSLFEVKAKSL